MTRRRSGYSQALKRLQLTHLRETLAVGCYPRRPRSNGPTWSSSIRSCGVRWTPSRARRIRMGLQIAHFPCVRTIEGFDFAFQPSADERLIRELSTGNFIAHGENVLMFGPPGVGKSHLAIGLGRKVVEQGHTVRFTTATALLAILGKAESEGNLGEKLTEYHQAPVVDHRRAGLFAVRAAGGAPVFPVGESPIREGEPAGHDEPAGFGMGNGLRRRGAGDGDFGPVAPSQPHADDHGRELPTS